jgi:hypothetical protein
VLNVRERIRALLAGEPQKLAEWTCEAGWRWPLACWVTVVAGCAFYGFTLGLWRDATQSFFTAVKFPLLIFLTCGGNALLNGCLAQVLGAGLGFRQTMVAILMSFTIAALVLAAFAPVMLFLLWNTPPLAVGRAVTGHSVTLLAHVVLISFAGVIGNHRLLRLLSYAAGSNRIAWTTLLSWLGGNLLLGSQISWILRPFIGSPGLPVEFLRADPLRGNFFEAVWSSIHHLIR